MNKNFGAELGQRSLDRDHLLGMLGVLNHGRTRPHEGPHQPRVPHKRADHHRRRTSEVNRNVIATRVSAAQKLRGSMPEALRFPTLHTAVFVRTYAQSGTQLASDLRRCLALVRGTR